MTLLFDHLERPIITPNHTTFAMLSPVRLPVVCLSVTLVHPTQWVGCTTVRRLKFSAIFLCRLVRWPSADIQEKFHGDHPRGTTPSWELNTRGVANNIAILDLSKAISRERCKIGSKLVLITNSKSHMTFRLVPKLVKIEWPWTA